MNDIDKSIVTSVIGGVTGLLAYFCGLPWELLIIWSVLMVLDILTGIIKSVKAGDWSSREMKHGLLKKSLEVIIMFSLLLVQRVAIINGINIPAGSIIVGIFCFKEFGSIVENYISMGNKLPEMVMKWFKTAKDQIEK